MPRKSKIIQILRAAEDLLILFDSYFRDPTWVTLRMGLPDRKLQKTKWYLLEKDLISEDFKLQKRDFSIYKFIKEWDGRWRIVSFDIPESERKVRSAIRRLLKGLGFKGFQRSVWISPLALDDRLQKIKSEVDDISSFYIFKGQLPKGESEELVQELWDYELWAKRVRVFVQDKEKYSNQEFNRRFWDFILGHPKLPLDLLPANWPLEQLVNTFLSLNN